MIVAGLDQDYLGRPFEPMPQLLAIAEYITKTLAICVVCGDPANHTQRLVASSDRVLVGADDSTRRAAATVSTRRWPGPDNRALSRYHVPSGRLWFNSSPVAVPSRS